MIVLVVTFVNAGLWQLRRLDQRRQYNAEIEKNMATPVTPLGNVLGTSATFPGVTEQLNRRVRVTGRYLIDEEIIITGQANNSVPGVWVVTPLLVPDGRVLLVNRGWIPSTGAITKPQVDARPPSGVVTVTGLISETQTAIAGESPERNAARQQSFVRIDIRRIQKQFSQKLVPAFLLRTGQQPKDPGPVVPAALDPPDLSEGPHLGYAFQWFSFAGLAIVGYPILLSAVARDREKKRRGDASHDELPDGAFIDEDGIIDMTEVDQH